MMGPIHMLHEQLLESGLPNHYCLELVLLAFAWLSRNISVQLLSGLVQQIRNEFHC